jgi:hypothetical protein
MAKKQKNSRRKTEDQKLEQMCQLLTQQALADTTWYHAILNVANDFCSDSPEAFQQFQQQVIMKAYATDDFQSAVH